MRVLLAGASGALGHASHQPSSRPDPAVFGTTRSGNTASIAAAGATPLRMDGLDRDSVMAAVEEAKPDVIIHQLTALERDGPEAVRPDLRAHEPAAHRGDRPPARGGADVRGGPVPGAELHRLDQPAHGRTGLADETAGLDPHPAPQSRQTLAAIRHVEEAVGGGTDLEGVVLRYGGFYGPGTGIAMGEDGEILEMIRQRKMPARRGRRRGLVLRPRRRRGERHRRGGRARRARPLQHRRRRARPDVGVATCTGRGARCQAAGAGPGVARSHPHRRARGQPHDEDPWLVQRQGQARARWTLTYPTWRIGFAQGL